ncbi:MAG: HAMP domain-containing protein [bacterium]|nr:HAMP domain-containing protein [bacterium]
MQLGMPSKEVRNMVRRLGFFNLVLVPVLLIIAAVGGYFFVRRAFRPVRRIVKTVNNITSEDLSLRIEEQVLKDEIGELIDTFNNMIGRLQKSFQAIKEFAGNASHELKTPLTVIRGEIEVALRKDRDSAEYKTILASVQGATSDLQLIIDDLLFLARMDSETVSFSFKELDLEELILATHEENYAMAEKKKITVILDRIDSVRIKGNRTLLSRLFSNLMRNAINYSGEDGQIRLTLSETEEGTAFVIADTGIGIPAEALPRIFDSFYRVDESHSPGTGGAGLGLAIVKRIVEFHKGVIEVESELGKGTKFTIRFPSAGSA